MTSYFTHDNGARPFKVVVSGANVSVYRKENVNIYSAKPILTLSGTVFIGKSPVMKMTEFSGGAGPTFDGNSILVCTGQRCVYIGSSIYSFRVLAPITYYNSPVGNNDVPYPYAIDKLGNYYLMLAEAMIKANPKLAEEGRNYDDPYDYYYAVGLITIDKGSIPSEIPKLKNKDGVVGYSVGEEDYTLRYKPKIDKQYDMMAEDGPTYFTYTDGTKKVISKEQFAKFMHTFGEQAGFEPMKDIVVLVPRK